jgi:hypothetical protein
MPTPEIRLAKVNDPALHSILDSKLRLICAYSSPLFLDGTLAGSGTFITWADQYGILTAHHVPNNPGNFAMRFDVSANSQQKVGLALAGYAHRFELEMRNLSIENIAPPIDLADPGRGPDLAVIKLGNSATVQAIAARKSFYRIDFDPSGRLEQSLFDDGIFVICGAAKESEQAGGPELGFDEVKIEELTTYYGGLVPPSGRRFERDGYGYAELGIHHDGPDTLPSTFRGVSGGGLWRIEVTANPQKGYIASDPVLSGVAFYETEVIDHQGQIRCHAGDAIYNATLNGLLAA